MVIGHSRPVVAIRSERDNEQIWVMAMVVVNGGWARLGRGGVARRWQRSGVVV